MIDLKSVTLDHSLRVPNVTDASSDVDQFGMLEAPIRRYVGGAFHDLGAGYILHRLGHDPGDVCVMYNGRRVGFYQSQVVAVDPFHGKKHLALRSPLPRSITGLASVARTQPRREGDPDESLGGRERV